MTDIDTLIRESTELLSELIRTPSISREETGAARKMRDFLNACDIRYKEQKHNTWCFNRHYHKDKPTILLNSHIDTVKPANGWNTDPFDPVQKDGKLIGLGSNDAGGPLVGLLAAFRHFYDRGDLSHNLCFAATAEEEISGQHGIEMLKDITDKCAFGIIGEPTQMEMAVAERGLMVIDGTVHGRTGHAARDEGVNALYLALDDIQWIRQHRFPKSDPLLGGIRMTVTMMEAGYQHNVVPDTCKYVIDVRTVATYTHEEILETIRKHTHATILPRSTRLRPSSIGEDHVLVKTASKLGIPTFASTTLSDQALLDIPTVKMGPGASERSHTPDEFIRFSEIDEGIRSYIRLLEAMMH